MDQIEPLFPIPLLRSPQLLSPALNEAAVAAIRSARIESNLRSDQLFHTEVADPRDNKLFQEIAELVGPKLVDFGVLLFGKSCAGPSRRCGPTCSRREETRRSTPMPIVLSQASSTSRLRIRRAGRCSCGRLVGLISPSAITHEVPRWDLSTPASTCCPRPNREISCCFPATSITKCLEIRASRESRSPSTLFPTAWIAGATGSTSRPEPNCAGRSAWSLAEFSRQDLPCFAA